MKPALRRAHRRIWSMLAVALTLILFAGWSLRQHDVPQQPSVRIGALTVGSAT